MRTALFTTLAAFGLLLAYCLLHGGPPPVTEASPADREAFSLENARQIQRTLSSPPYAPHAIGSAGARELRTFLADRLKASGWSVEVQHALGCSRYATCGFVDNVVATRPGREAGFSAVLLMAHYDAVPASPGASDDGMGVAALVEVARALGSGEATTRPLVLVLTDGEESGLLGAEAFAHDHPLAKTVGVVVNVDARGSSGPSLLFETSADNRWLVDLASEVLPHPVTSSLFQEVYRRMPNDTDFSVAKGFAAGVNFANLARIENYHTSHDDYENASPETLHHHGTQVLAMTRALAEAAEVDHPPQGDAVWFDVFSRFVVRWPIGWTLPLGVAGFLLVFAGALTTRAFVGGARGLFAGVGALVAALLASMGISALLGAVGALSVPWVADARWPLAALHGSALLGGLAVGGFIGRTSSPRVVLTGTWLVWGALGVVVARVAPGAAYLFLIPAIAAGLAASFPPFLAATVPALVAGALWIPLAKPIYETMGFALGPAVCIGTTMLVTTLVPMLVGLFHRPIPVSQAGYADAAAAPPSRMPWGALLLGLGAMGVAASVGAAAYAPKFSEAMPQRVNVLFRQDGANGAAPANTAPAAPTPARVFVDASWGPRAWGAPPKGMIAALGSEPAGKAAPWPGMSPAPFVDVPRQPLLPPSVTSLGAASASGERKGRLHVQPTGAASTLLLVIGPPSAEDDTSDVTLPEVHLRIAGRDVTATHGRLLLRALPANGIDIEVRATTDAILDVLAVQLATGVPPGSAADASVNARRALGGVAVASQEGDVTITTARTRL